MKKIEFLKKNEEFRNVYKKGKSCANKYLVMYVADNNRDTNRIGISVSKKVGNSVVRHRITRIMREVHRLNNDKLIKGKDIVVVARVNSKGKDYFEMEKSYLHLCKIHNILEQSDENEKNINQFD